ncbi:NADH-quinone oxidoreductase subunit C [Methylacidimicrobium cyclopophantes]|uniref:NADH-quinone oxidoreductase subunit C n=1 Tax=Methylacidimicrobium cyclopophantes TaxID=1041766 RepID=A0A5E6M679_9BACT|nr:NADH-quinone oxidoreductase subunit C [Methylacidimicrobium cyclopophantes]VVM05054.1 NADH-quinone oxidoreductase subunit C [Methylacidimicrobium cyclopophantes]
MSNAEAVEKLRASLGTKVQAVGEFRGETTVRIDLSAVQEAAKLLKEIGYRTLLDLTSVDHLGEEPRFEIVYHFFAAASGELLRLKGRVTGEEPTAPSLAGVYATANWQEREAFDMMGIRFAGHPDLRRILMWEGYPFFPLRKDFPLEGKDSDAGEMAFSRRAPLEGGPFVTRPAAESGEREPRAHPAEELPEETL